MAQRSEYKTQNNETGESNTGETLEAICVGKDFQNKITKARETISKIKKRGHIKL